MKNLSGEVADILRVDAVRLVLESMEEPDDAVRSVGEVLVVRLPGFGNAYVTEGRSGPARPVVLRQVQVGDTEIYGDKASWIRSEACLSLDFGDDKLPGLLVLGAEDPHHFSPQQGTDLLGFFGGVFERAMRRWLA